MTKIKGESRRLSSTPKQSLMDAGHEQHDKGDFAAVLDHTKCKKIRISNSAPTLATFIHIMLKKKTLNFSAIRKHFGIVTGHNKKISP